MALRLRKTKPTIWNGNGFGSSSATWTLADHPGWTIFQCGNRDWVARHDDGRQYDAWTRKLLLEKLVPLLDGSRI